MRQAALVIVGLIGLVSAKGVAGEPTTHSAVEGDRDRLLAGLIGETKRHVEQGRYAEASKLIETILIIDPKNEYATNVGPVLLDRVGPPRLKPTTADYPANWPDGGGRRDQMLSGPDDSGAARALLAKKIPETRFDQVALSDVIDFLRDTTQLNIFVDWASLEIAGVDRNKPVSCRLKNVSTRRVLRTVMDNVTPAESAGTPDTLLMCVEEGVVTIMTKRKAYATATTTKNYPIGDLLAGSGHPPVNGNPADLVRLIKEVIAPDSWPAKADDVGGKLSIIGNDLVVQQLPEVQDEVAAFLAKRREQNAAKP